MATVPTAEPKPTPWLTPWQFRLFVLPFAVVVWLSLRLLIHAPDDARQLWTDPLGVRMLGGATALLLVGTVIFFGGCRLLNRAASRLRGATFLVAQSVLVVVWGFGFCLPTGFVLKVGPSAVQIQKNLIRD